MSWFSHLTHWVGKKVTTITHAVINSNPLTRAAVEIAQGHSIKSALSDAIKYNPLHGLGTLLGNKKLETFSEKKGVSFLANIGTLGVMGAFNALPGVLQGGAVEIGKISQSLGKLKPKELLTFGKSVVGAGTAGLGAVKSINKLVHSSAKTGVLPLNVEGSEIGVSGSSPNIVILAIVGFIIYLIFKK
jgi:hypothetical protein